ncbi:hypothetical protein BCR35DRAFT_330883 [Leucosporidium creatinivorum]|uniref:Uncharacterized protein n=1 Tax=Leucosporidium creatinivorum TaxID=106004 RepID=A0A1Y2FP76_9BASI|nr:hypothetical protein BCR35DRAFT_330883 [Leucosporidium creatinivorum]
MNSDEEALRRPLSGGAAAPAPATESPDTLRRKRVAHTWLFGAVGSVISGLALCVTGAALTQGGESSGPFYWLIVCGALWLSLGVILAVVIKELQGRQHRYKHMNRLQMYTLGILLVMSIVITGGGLWFASTASGLSTLVQVGIWCQLVPWGVTFWAIHKYKVYSNAWRRFEQRHRPLELDTLPPAAPPSPLRRNSTAQGSTHSHPSRRSSTRRSQQDTQAAPATRSWGSFGSHRAAEEGHDEEAVHHSRRGSQVSGHTSLHDHGNSTDDNDENLFPYDEHPPYRRVPPTPSAPHSVHLSHRRVPSNESLPDHDIFDLPRRSTASHITRAQPFDPTAPHQIHHAPRPSHSAISPPTDLPSSWHHDGSTPI